MSIAALEQVHQEVRRLAIAGSELAAGDFRLKKLIPPLEKSAAKAPVFGKVAGAIQKLVDGDPKASPPALLELSTLVSAILYTQGETGADGELGPVDEEDLGLTITTAGARVLKPVIAALTTSGGGRLEIIRDAHQRGLFKDVRLVLPAIAGLDDSYSEIAEYLATEVLPQYGKAIYHLLPELFDPKGNNSAARALRLMHQLDPAAARPLVAQALEEGSKEVKLAAIDCLEGRRDAVTDLLLLALGRSKEVRAAAFRVLAPMDDPKAIDLLLTTLGGAELELVAPYVAANPNPAVATFVVAELERQHALLSERPEKTTKAAPAKKAPAKKEGADPLHRIHQLLQAIRVEAGTPGEAFLLRCLDDHEVFAKLTATSGVTGEAVILQVATKLLLARSAGGIARLDALGPQVGAALLSKTFLASALSHTPEQVFERYRPLYVDRPAGKTKAATTAREKAEAVGEVLSWIGRRAEAASTEDSFDWSDRFSSLTALAKGLRLDPRWLDAALAVGDTDRVLALAAPGHPGVEAHLEAHLRAELQKKRWSPEPQTVQVVGALVHLGHPRRVPLFLEVAKRLGDQTYWWWTTRELIGLVPSLPAEAAEPLEALVPDLHSSQQDQLLEQIAILRQKQQS